MGFLASSSTLPYCACWNSVVTFSPCVCVGNVCVSVFICTWVYITVGVHVYAHMHSCVCWCMFTWVCVCVRARVCTRACAHVFRPEISFLIFPYLLYQGRFLDLNPELPSHIPCIYIEIGNPNSVAHTYSTSAHTYQHVLACLTAWKFILPGYGRSSQPLPCSWALPSPCLGPSPSALCRHWLWCCE